jgi:hypothetical protein
MGHALRPVGFQLDAGVDSGALVVPGLGIAATVTWSTVFFHAGCSERGGCPVKRIQGAGAVAFFGALCLLGYGVPTCLQTLRTG